ncbi:MAG TPA: hypothetical protein DEG44_05245, partial [Candidatus Kerfeldbacteria bacterium]|nr:hypothetical protein [Candidatus Kerfeldbacteria bacterium]
MRQRFSQTLPLIGTLCLLIIGSAVLFKFTPPADAIMNAEAIAEPPADTGDLTNSEIEDGSRFEEPDLPFEYTRYEVSDFLETEQDQVSGIYVAADDVVELDQHYLNDVFVAGNTITVTGTIDGDLFAAGNTIIVRGDVMGSIRAAGSVVQIESDVGRNVMVLADQLQFGQDARVMKDVMFGARLLENLGTIFGNITGSAETVDQAGAVYGTIDIEDTSQQKKVEQRKTFLTPLKALGLFLKWIGYIILGIVVLVMLPKFSQGVVKTMRSQPGRSFGYGAVAVLVAPIAFIILIGTLIGIPLAVFAGLVWLVIICLAKLYVGVAVGQMLL